jgi:hypothetical protein
MASMVSAQHPPIGGLAKLGEGARTTSDLSRVGGGLSRGANEGKKLNAAPWSDTFPAAGATLDLDFANNRGFVRGVGQGGVMDAITFTRASTGWYIGEDGLLQEAGNGEPRFDWASTEQVANRNLLAFTEQFDNSYWAKPQTTVVADTIATTDPLGTNTADLFYPTLSGSFRSVQRAVDIASLNIKTISVYAKSGGLTWLSIRDNINAWAFFDLTNGVLGTVTSGYTASITDVGDGWYRCVATNTNGVVSFPTFMASDANGGAFVTATGTNGYYLWGAQGEIGTIVTDYTPVSFPTSSTPLRANPTSNGILIEEARTNRLLWNRDATQTEWVKTNITAAKDQTGIDGVANAASSLTATDDNGTCIQTITLAAGNRTGSVYLKRLTGTGLIQITLDGLTYSTVELSDTEWYRIVLSGSVTNPTVGIKIVVDGDAVAMDYGQVEDGLFFTTPILTTTATATRAIDTATISGVNFKPEFFRSYYGAIYTETQLTAPQGEQYYWFTALNTNRRVDARYQNTTIGTTFGNPIPIDVTKTAKALFRWDAGNINLTANGIIGPRSALNLEFFTFLTLDINNYFLARFGSGYIKRHVWIPSRISVTASVDMTK